MTYAEIEQNMPEEFAARKADKLGYRCGNQIPARASPRDETVFEVCSAERRAEKGRALKMLASQSRSSTWRREIPSAN